MWYEKLIIILVPVLVLIGLIWWKGAKVGLITYGLIIVLVFVAVYFALSNFRG
jgi:hypothetical protein